jgi:hypothetical protein
MPDGIAGAFAISFQDNYLEKIGGLIMTFSLPLIS